MSGERSYLYIGDEPKEGGSPLLIGNGFVPIAWFTLFTIDQSITRQDEFPGKWLQEGSQLGGQGAEDLDVLLEYMQETIGFRTHAGEALTNLQRFQSNFLTHKYYRAYFRCLSVLEQELHSLPSEAPVVVHFDELVKGPNDEGRIYRSILRDLYLISEHISNGEGSDPDVIDIFKDIFRSSLGNRRISPSGVLSTDLKKFRPKDLLRTMLGEFSPSSGKSFKDYGPFDLRYWVHDSLTKEDTFLMYELSVIPGERAKKAIEQGILNRALNSLMDEFLSYLTIGEPELSLKTLSKKPDVTNLWSIRVMVLRGKTYVPATILAPRNGSTWIDRLTSEVKLPSVREDWNYTETLYFSSLRDSGKYKIVFSGARDMDEVKKGYVRWLRKARWRYLKAYGSEAFITMLGEHLLRVEDPEEGRRILELLTDVANLGFSQATEILTREDIVARIPFFLQ